MSTFVLVHGAWGGAHGWRWLRPLLRDAGHEVFSPSLTGQGERAHLSSPDVNLSIHILDVMNAIHYEDLSEIVLVGHSYGGMVVTGVADLAPDRISHLVYLDAFLPKDGESVFSITAPMESPGEDWRIYRRGADSPPANETPDEAWSRVRFVGQPRGTMEEPVTLSTPLEARPFTRTYIKASGDARNHENPGPFWPVADRVRNDPAGRYHELPCGHSVQREMPRELADILLALV